MKLTVFNGSPRGKNSNSSVIIKWLEEGIRSREGCTLDVYYLNRAEAHQDYAEIFGSSDGIILVFPLYTDAMPGIVMAFIEKLAPLTGRMGGKQLGFIVHSGFPEPAHSRYIQRYLELLCGRLGADYSGTCVLGGSEGLRFMPEASLGKKRLLFNRLGDEFVSHGRFSPDTLKGIAGKEKLSAAACFLVRLASLTGMLNGYWNMMLRKNHAFDKRYAQPYISPHTKP